MANGVLLYPSYFAPSTWMVRALVYMPSLNSCLFFDSDSTMPFKLLDLKSRSIVQSLPIKHIHDPHVITLSSDEMFLATDAEYGEKVRTQIRITPLSKDGREFESVSPVQSRYILPDFNEDSITSIKFFPDGKKIVATRYRDVNFGRRNGAWLFMYDVPENLLGEETESGSSKVAEQGTLSAGEANVEDCKHRKSSDDSDVEQNVEVEGFEYSGKLHHNLENKNLEGTKETKPSSITEVEEHVEPVESSGKFVENYSDGEEPDPTKIIRNEVYFDAYEVNVMKQGYSIPPSPPSSSSESEPEFIDENDYYDWRYRTDVPQPRAEPDLYRYPSGFYCLAVSPDTTRLLTGNHDGEVFIVDEYNFDVLQCIQAYEKDTVVSGCHYNPVFAHESFATCGGEGKEGSMLNIWNVEPLEDGKEKASCVHSISLESMPVNCCYFPDGQLIAVTCSDMQSYVVCSKSGVVFYTLTFMDERPKASPRLNGSDAFGVTLFAGHTCQVVTTPNHKNSSIAIWDLPIVYSLETLCLLILRANIKYIDIDNLLLPDSLKLRLKYLYV